jgi:hypothetical protein
MGLLGLDASSCPAAMIVYYNLQSTSCHLVTVSGRTAIFPAICGALSAPAHRSWRRSSSSLPRTAHTTGPTITITVSTIQQGKATRTHRTSPGPCGVGRGQGKEGETGVLDE